MQQLNQLLHEGCLYSRQWDRVRTSLRLEPADDEASHVTGSDVLTYDAEARCRNESCVESRHFEVSTSLQAHWHSQPANVTMR